ncbi:Monothiol glutaredoxin-S5 [Capsicum annuum]|nr:Monothiol glutaredoxin-S5 [Capsicum annuum]KAF3681310.1 Monothiol glutaredoxin-S5 [Capsicum annuum]
MHRTSALRSSAAPAASGSSSGGSGMPLRHSFNPMVFKVEEEEKSSVLMKLSKMNEGFNSSTGGPWDLPAVYIEGKYLRGFDKVMESHVKGELVPMLKKAGALWL